jgi:hypothetical protein
MGLLFNAYSRRLSVTFDSFQAVTAMHQCAELFTASKNQQQRD